MFHDSDADRFKPETVDAQAEQPANQQLAEALRMMHKPALQEEDRASLRRVQQQFRQRSARETQSARLDDSSPGKLYILSNHAARQQRNRRVSPVLASLVALLLMSILVGMFVARAHNSQLLTALKTVVPTQNNLYTLSKNNALTKLDSKSGAVIWQQTVPHVSQQDYAPYSHLDVQNGTVYAIFDYDIYALHASNGHVIWHTRATTSIQSANTSVVIDGTSVYVHHYDGTFAAYSTRDGTQQWHNTSFHTTGNMFNVNITAFQVQHGSIYTHLIRDNQSYLYALSSATGSVSWYLNMPSSFTITLSANGTVYCIASNYLYAVDEETGKLQWKQHSLELTRFTQLYLINGIVYTVTGNVLGDSDLSGIKSRVYAFAASSGKLLWATPIGHGLLTENGDVVPIAGTTQLSQNGYLFVNSNLKHGHTIQALNMKDGKVAWQVDVPMSTIYVSGRIANHALYLTNANVALPRQFVSIDPRTGKFLASSTLTQSYKSTGILGNDSQHIYLGIGSELGIIQAIASVRLSDGSMLWQKQLTPPSDRIYQVIMAP